MTTVTWTGAAGDQYWQTADNWSTDAVPDASSDVVIPSLASGVFEYVWADESIGIVNSIAIGEDYDLQLWSSVKGVVSDDTVTRNMIVQHWSGLTVGSGQLTIGGTAKLTIGGTLKNKGTAQLFVGADVIAHSLVNMPTGANRNGDSGYFSMMGGNLTTTKVDNTGVIRINDAGDSAIFNVTDWMRNDGTFDISDFDASGHIEKIAGAIVGTGEIEFNQSTLEFRSRVSSGQTIDFGLSGSDVLDIRYGQQFAAELKQLASGDKIDVMSYAYLQGETSFVYQENSADTGGVLTLTGGPTARHLAFVGNYTQGDFSIGPATGIGTLINFA